MSTTALHRRSSMARHLVPGGLLVGALVLAVVGWRGPRATQDPAAAQRATALMKTRMETALARQLRPIEDAANKGAALAPLRAALEARLDGASLRDLLESEEWWLPFRANDDSARIVDGKRVVNVSGFEVLESVDGLVASAGRGEKAVGVFAGREGPLLVAAARILARDPAPVLILAAPADTEVLRNLTNETHLEILLAQGNQILGLAADPSLEGTLRGLVTNARAEEALLETGTNVLRLNLSPKLVLWGLERSRLSPRPGSPLALIAGGVLALLAVVAWGWGPLQRSRRNTTGGVYQGQRPTREVPWPLGGPAPETAPVHSTAKGFAAPSPAPVASPVSSAERVSGVVRSTSGMSTMTGEAPSAGPLMAPQEPGAPPKTFGRYKLLRPVGEGGMSEVYTATSQGAEGFARTFVLKRLRPELARDKESVSQFIDEARLQAGLVHTNIVPVFDFGKIGAEYFLTMEYIIGKNLYEVAQACAEKTGHCLDQRMVFYFMHEVLQGLSYAHTKKDAKGRPLGIVHRDVSATNVMVSASGDVKLFDFGIAKAHKRQTRTQAGMVKGNASFMSPEQARGQAVDGRSDVFAAGLVTYFCLTNRLLYEGENELDILYRAASGPQEADLTNIRALPEPAALIVRKALQTSPESRYQSAAEMAAAFAPHIAGLRPAAAVLMDKLFGDQLRQEEAEHAQDTPLLAASQISRAHML